MGLLANCWLIIDCYLIPAHAHGFRKWFYLSFYIHPFFLLFCQIFLWIKTLHTWIFLVIFFLDRYIFSRILGVVRRFSPDGHGDMKVEDEDVWYEAADSYSSLDTSSGILFVCYDAEIPKIGFCDIHVDQDTVSVCSSSDLDNESTSSFSGASSQISSFALDTSRDMEVFSNIPPSLSEEKEDEVVIGPHDVEQQVEDSFYKLYSERMSWFDLVNKERTYGLNAILRKKQHLDGGEKRIVKSLESEIEMVYVAQSCLSWEALHDQYRKLEAVVAAADGALCSSSLATKFQRFQILVERFMEDERCEKGKRYWNFIHKRSSLNTLLQVPQASAATYISISSHNNVGIDNGRNGGLMIQATDLLKTIEKCIKTFKSFIQVDEKKPQWRTSGCLSWSNSPLEDPRDANLLHHLIHTLRQKELWMKNLEGKRRCWLRRRVEHLGDVEKKDMMFATIELKLVARVLMMSVISTPQLQWCQRKLDNIDMSHGRITRSYTDGSLLFPP